MLHFPTASAATEAAPTPAAQGEGTGIATAAPKTHTGYPAAAASVPRTCS